MHLFICILFSEYHILTYLNIFYFYLCEKYAYAYLKYFISFFECKEQL